MFESSIQGTFILSDVSNNRSELENTFEFTRIPVTVMTFISLAFPPLHLKLSDMKFISCLFVSSIKLFLFLLPANTTLLIIDNHRSDLVLNYLCVTHDLNHN